MKKLLTVCVFAICGISAALADPIAPYGNQNPQQMVQSPRNANTSPRNANAQNVNAAAAKAGMVTTAANQPVASPSRSVGARSTSPRSSAATAGSRSVVARTATPRGAAQNRAVVSRVGVASSASQASARVSLRGNAMQGPTGTSLTYANMRNAYVSYQNIIDPMTGLISADAYNNCIQSYYTCMDEICTARSPGQRRCACAGRVKTFADLEATLTSAKEDLLKVSGELTLFITAKGKNVNSAFSLTDAEKTMNCVSWRDVVMSGGDKGQWCYDHLVENTNSSTNSKGDKVYACPATFNGPAYCASTGEDGIGLGSDWMKILNGSDSDIISALRTYADASNKANVIIRQNDSDLNNAIRSVEDVINSLNGGTALFGTSTVTPDSLAETWGYELFQYAHNNVCNRVLDACFNGIYESCGSHDGTTGPYNLNSIIKVINGGQDLDFTISGASGQTATAACYGYTATNGDPYNTLRKPVADARRSVLQKYALDSNADCDIYGEELKKQAQNMNYQRIAATQLLQQKRLAFATEEENLLKDNLTAAKSNFNNCVNEIYDCYNNQLAVNPGHSVARRKSYCSQVAEIPSCYETMICNQEAGAIIEVADSVACSNVSDYTKNSCRNVVRLSEILNGASATATAPGPTGDSAKFREYCLQKSPGIYGEGSVREYDQWGRITNPNP